MVLVQLLGMAAFMAASLVLGVKLLRLWRRTGEFSELAVGLSFLLGGAVGYGCFLALNIALQRGDPELGRLLTLAGFLFSGGGAMFMGCAAKGIYRPANAWPWALLGGVAAVMAGGWIALYLTPVGTPSDAFWVGITPSAFVYLWVGVEGFLLYGVLAKRARLGMAEPTVVGRAFQWGLSCVFVFVLIVIGPIVRIAVGPDAAAFPPWASMAQSMCGLATAAAIWLGFFPPAFYRERLARSYGA